MLELREILKVTADGGDDDGVLATLVDVKGSGYRLAGARMLIGPDGRSIGTVSGGCLEADILERANQVRRTGEPTLITYDTTKNDNSIFGLGMGCRGVVRVLLEPAGESETLSFIRGCFDSRMRGAVSTLISKTGSVDVRVFGRYFSHGGSVFAGQNGAELNGLLSPVTRDATTAMGENRSRCVEYKTATGTAEFFHEVINPPTAIMIFGAGHDAVPLSQLSSKLGWRISVIDHRPAWATTGRFPEADEVLVVRPNEIRHEFFQDENFVAVVMNHNYDADRELLRRLIPSTCRYVGVLGPKTRTEKLIDELRDEGSFFTSEQLDRLYAPVGLDIGASTPEGIALSIVAEIQAVLAGRNGGSLRNRQEPIYDR